MRASIAWPRRATVDEIGQPLARRHAQLQLDEIEPRHHLGHGVLDL